MLNYPDTEREDDIEICRACYQRASKRPASSSGNEPAKKVREPPALCTVPACKEVKHAKLSAELVAAVHETDGEPAEKEISLCKVHYTAVRRFFCW